MDPRDRLADTVAHGNEKKANYSNEDDDDDDDKNDTAGGISERRKQDDDKYDDEVDDDEYKPHHLDEASSVSDLSETAVSQTESTEMLLQVSKNKRARRGATNKGLSSPQTDTAGSTKKKRKAASSIRSAPRNNTPADESGEDGEEQEVNKEKDDIASHTQSRYHYDGNNQQQRQGARRIYDSGGQNDDDEYDDDAASYHHFLGWEFQRRRLLTPEPKMHLLPATTRATCSSSLPAIVDFDKLAASAAAASSSSWWWSDRVLYDTLSVDHIDRLVGVAHTLEDGRGARPETNVVVLDPSVDTGNEEETVREDENDQASDIHAAPLPTLPLRQQQEKEEVNPLLSVASGPPLPLSFLKYIQRIAATQVTKDASKKAAAFSQLGDSAAVAMGMAVEDAVTAALLPLAGLHVLRCRALEDMAEPEEEIATSPAQDYNNTKLRTSLHPITGKPVCLDMEKIPWKTEKTFEEWTLPPSEAIMKLLEQGLISKSDNHFLSEPRRKLSSTSLSPDVNETTAATTTASSNNKRTQAERIMHWSKRLNVAPSVVAANPELMRVFMTHSNVTAMNHR